MKVSGPAEKTPEAKALPTKHGFPYCTLLGELVLALVVCRLDIGYAVCFLSQFSDVPHDDHYHALCHVAKYLCRTKHWGLFIGVLSLCLISLICPMRS